MTKRKILVGYGVDIDAVAYVALSQFSKYLLVIAI